MRDLGRDLKYALRLLARSRAFAAAAVATLAIGIGANTAIFSVLNAVLLRPLPYADPDRLVEVGALEGDGTVGNVGYATFVDWRARSHAFEGMAAVRPWTPMLAIDGRPERISVLRVSANFFRLLGVRPALGRDFSPGDDAPERWRTGLVSDRLWRKAFGSDPRIVGRTISMNDQTVTIAGVMPASFEPLISEHFYQRADMWAPLGYSITDPFACRTCQHLKAIARLRTGLSVADARRDVDGVHQQIRREHPGDYPPETLTVVPLETELTGNVRPALVVLMGAVAFLLLIACANVANLLLARVAERQRDMALRAALGASRARLVRQLLIESAIVAIAGGVLGVVAAWWTVPVLTHLAPVSMARLDSASVDGRVLAFSLAASMATALLFGIIPSFRTTSLDLQPLLHGGDRRTPYGPASAARRLLIAADVALAVVLLTGAGLMIKSVGRLLAVDPGFDPDHVLTLQISLVGRAYAEDPAVVTKVDQILAGLRRLPGVEGAAAAGQIPLGGNGDRWGFHIQGKPPSPTDPSVERYSVTPDYFPVMRIPLRRGRLFTDADRAGSDPVLIVGEQTARTLWPGGDPIGARVAIGGSDGPWRRIVGVVGDVRHRELAQAPTMQMYAPEAQLTDSFLTLVVRSRGDASVPANEARRVVWSAASDVPVYAVAPLADVVSRSVATRRFIMLLLTLFGVSALVMTAVGIYGVLASSVAERTRELGVRVALGAPPRAIVRLVLGGGMLVVAGGLAAGSLAAIGATRYLETLLYGVTPTDPATFAAVVIVLFAVALAAQAIPVIRATRVDPTVALRSE